MTKTKIDDGGPAFPEPVAIGPSGDAYPAFGGMTLRDYFAGQALAGLAASPMTAEMFNNLKDPSPDAGWRTMAKASYAVADAMLSARSSGGASDG